MKFILEELPTLGGSGVRTPPERFEWDADHMSAPKREAFMGHTGEQKIRRIDYPGAIGVPTIQVMGPALGPQTFKGTWNDRYNGEGYAKAEKRRLLGVCYRGNAVRVQFDDMVITGVITSWDFPYQMDWKIEYQFTIEVANDEIIGTARTARSPDAVTSAPQLVDAIETLFTEGEAVRDQPEMAEVLEGDIFGDIADAMGDVRTQLDDLNAVLDVRLSSGQDRSGLLRAVQSVRSARLATLDVLSNVGQLRADTSLQYRTAVSELRFETWSRSVGYQTRLLGLECFRAERQLAETADPAAIATYRPREGESLYEVSQKLYGTPHYWRALADANRLETFVLDGTIDLVVPENPAG